MLSNILVLLGNHKNAKIEEGMVRHMIINGIRSYRAKFKHEFGELVIACDNTNYWRKKQFPYYKANRKKNNEESELDWNAIYTVLNKVRAELKEYFPYKVIEIPTAEADDVIASLVKWKGSILEADSDKDKILILSGDKDFIQLQTYKNVKQYDPTRKKWITHNDPALFLKEHILKGDASDGIPNVLSEDNCFVVGIRQKPLTAKRKEAILSSNVDDLESSVARNYYRNALLIDLSLVPKEIYNQVLESYEQQKSKDKSKLLNYFIEYKLSNLIEKLNDF